MKIAEQKTSISELAKAELETEKVKEATGELKKLYRELDAAEKIVRNVKRKIDDYLEEVDS